MAKETTMKTQETISTRILQKDQEYLMKLKKRNGYNSVATTLNKVLTIFKQNKFEGELR